MCNTLDFVASDIGSRELVYVLRSSKPSDLRAYFARKVTWTIGNVRLTSSRKTTRIHIVTSSAS
jgi:hypothetical protein